MHEVDMTRCLIHALEEWRVAQPATPRIRTIHLLVGDFTCVEPSQLVFTFAAATQGTWLAGASLAIEPVPLRGRCLACGEVYQPDPARGYASPCCAHPMDEIVSGRELKIKRIDD